MLSSGTTPFCTLKKPGRGGGVDRGPKYPGAAAAAAAPPLQLPQHICRISGFVQWPFAAACGQLACAPNRASISAVDASKHVPIGWAANTWLIWRPPRRGRRRSRRRWSKGAYRAPTQRMQAAASPARRSASLAQLSPSTLWTGSTLRFRNGLFGEAWTWRNCVQSVDRPCHFSQKSTVRADNATLG